MLIVYLAIIGSLPQVWIAPQPATLANRKLSGHFQGCGERLPNQDAAAPFEGSPPRAWRAFQPALHLQRYVRATSTGVESRAWEAERASTGPQVVRPGESPIAPLPGPCSRLGASLWPTPGPRARIFRCGESKWASTTLPTRPSVHLHQGGERPTCAAQRDVRVPSTGVEST